MKVHVVWFTRDLRLHDHAPLREAGRHGPVLGLYVLEPEVIGAPDFDAQYWRSCRRRCGSCRIGSRAVARA
jgi:deoxyribodipyrimidine photo-lyase